MGILQELSTKEAWADYKEHKLSCQNLTNKEERQLIEYIDGEQYLQLAGRLTKEGFCFDYPVKSLISKKASRKKRVVYCYSYDEQMILKCMSFLLYRYDSHIADSCYSFRMSKSAKDAIRKAACAFKPASVALKIDISNYFNSIPVEELCNKLGEVIDDDPELLGFMKKLLTADRAYLDHSRRELITEKRGAMAGTPISPFFADIFLRELDLHYEALKIPYFRYSDDCLLILNSEEEALGELSFIRDYLTEHGLRLNEDKVKLYKPGEGFEFLGISCHDGEIDLSEMTKNKIKGKIRRKGRAFYRWRVKNNVTYEKAAGSFIKLFNSKFYKKNDEKDFTWSRWFFPVLTCDKGLKEIDDYFLEYIRFLYSGRHYKGNYRVTYADIKKLGFKSLVNEYWRYRRETAD